MEKRVSKRIPANAVLSFPCCQSFRYGTATNISEKGIMIQTEPCFPMSSRLNVFISSGKEILKVPVRIARIVKKGNHYKGIAVEVVGLPKKYQEFLFRLGSGCKS